MNIYDLIVEVIKYHNNIENRVGFQVSHSLEIWVASMVQKLNESEIEDPPYTEHVEYIELISGIGEFIKYFIPYSDPSVKREPTELYKSFSRINEQYIAKFLYLVLYGDDDKHIIDKIKSDESINESILALQSLEDSFVLKPRIELSKCSFHFSYLSSIYFKDYLVGKNFLFFDITLLKNYIIKHIEIMTFYDFLKRRYLTEVVNISLFSNEAYLYYCYYLRPEKLVRKYAPYLDLVNKHILFYQVISITYNSKLWYLYGFPHFFVSSDYPFSIRAALVIRNRKILNKCLYAFYSQGVSKNLLVFNLLRWSDFLYSYFILKTPISTILHDSVLHVYRAYGFNLGYSNMGKVLTLLHVGSHFKLLLNNNEFVLSPTIENFLGVATLEEKMLRIYGLTTHYYTSYMSNLYKTFRSDVYFFSLMPCFRYDKFGNRILSGKCIEIKLSVPYYLVFMLPRVLLAHFAFLFRIICFVLYVADLLGLTVDSLCYGYFYCWFFFFKIFLYGSNFLFWNDVIFFPNSGYFILNEIQSDKVYTKSSEIFLGRQ